MPSFNGSLEITHDNNDLVAELFPGAVVQSESPTTENRRVETLKRAAEEGFTAEEKNFWSPEIRHAIAALSMHGYLELAQVGNENIRKPVVDITKFKTEMSWHDLRDEIGPIARGEYSRRKTQTETLARLSQDLGGVLAKNDSNDYTQAMEAELFYIPPADPFDVEAIKEVKCHLGLWEVCKSTTEFYPAREDKEPKDYTDVTLAALIYNPKWGNGHRDEYGNLMVNYPDRKEDRIKARFFEEWGFNARESGNGRLISNSPTKFLESQGHSLVEQGLLRPEDFHKHSGIGGIYESQRLTDRPVGRKGRVLVDGVAYFLGEEYNTDAYSVCKLSPDFACVIQRTADQLEISRVFKLMSPEEKAQQKSEGKVPFVGKKSLTTTGFYTPEEFAAKEPASKDLVARWQEFINFSNSLEKTGIDFVNYSVVEQAQLWSVLADKKAAKVLSEFLTSGEYSPADRRARAKTVLAVSGSLKDLTLLREIGKSPNSEFLFENVAAIYDVVTAINSYVNSSDKYDEDTQDRMRQVGDMVLKHAGRILYGTHDVLKRNNGITVQDATFVLYRYRRMVEDWQQDQFMRGSIRNNKYIQLLQQFDFAEPDTNMQTLLLGMIEQYWQEDVQREATGRNQSAGNAVDRIRGFYNGNVALFETAAQTTGDTERELSDLGNFFQKQHEINGYVLDLACGDRKRITEPMAEMLKGKAKVIGLDIWSPGENTQENLDVIQGSIGAIPLPSNSVAVATLNWSPPNDWVSRTEQLVNFNEIGRVMKPNGVLRADVAFLEGGEGSWQTTVESQYEAGADKYGDMKVMFPGGREGEFHIYPLSELKAMYIAAGFGDISVQVWRTKAGKPRVVLEAVYKGKSNPLA